jgi:hypothetical protein
MIERPLFTIWVQTERRGVAWIDWAVAADIGFLIDQALKPRVRRGKSLRWCILRDGDGAPRLGVQAIAEGYVPEEGGLCDGSHRCRSDRPLVH